MSATLVWWLAAFLLISMAVVNNAIGIRFIITHGTKIPLLLLDAFTVLMAWVVAWAM